MSHTPSAKPPHRAIRRGFQAFPLFFLGAALYAALAVPVWVLEYLGYIPAWQQAPAGWHAHEMVFGYTLAVVAGYLITKASRPLVLAAFGLWLAGRLAHFGPGLPMPLTVALDLAFPALVFPLAGLPFLRAAKSWRNALFGIVVGAFILAEAFYQSGVIGIWENGQEHGLRLAIDLVTLLLFAMGGRLIAATTSGAIQKKGGYLKGVAQPNLERAGVSCLVAATALNGWEPAAPVVAVLYAMAAAVIATRLLRWQFWKVIDLPEASLLHLGYFGLAAGLFVQAGNLGFDLTPPLDAAHGVMLGGLGILSLTVMARTTQQRLRRPITVSPALFVAVGFMVIAAVSRTAASIADPVVPLLALAASAWSLAFLCFAGGIVAQLMEIRYP